MNPPSSDPTAYEMLERCVSILKSLRDQLSEKKLPPDFFAFKHDLNETIAESLNVLSGGEQDA